MMTPAPGGDRERAVVVQEHSEPTALCTKCRTETELYQLARRVLHCDPLTGIILWKARRGNRLAGTIAGTVRPDGRRQIILGRRAIFASHLVVFLSFGFLPPGPVRHRNGDPTDDRLVNLELATRSQIAAGQGRRSNNRTGRKGVSINQDGRFVASITVRRQQRYLGTFDAIDDAHAVYSEAAREAFGEYWRPA